MKAFKILENKNFMSRFLMSDAFDDFLLAEANITTYNTFIIDGHIVSDFYKNNEYDAETTQTPYVFSTWKDMRGICFELIKGKRTPVSFRFTLHLKPELIDTLLSESEAALSSKNLAAYVLNVKYQEGVVSLVSAVSYQSFILDKTLDILWDNYLQAFLASKEIHFDEVI